MRMIEISTGKYCFDQQFILRTVFIKFFKNCVRKRFLRVHIKLTVESSSIYYSLYESCFFHL